MFNFSPKQRQRVGVAVVTMLLLVSTGCKRTPKGILDKEEMAELMADIHIGEAIVDFNYSSFPNDSTRRLLKQSIYAAHKVTPEEVDSSFSWYGHHIEDYIKVYDRTIEIIEERQKKIAAGNAQISVEGDSVDVWVGPRPLFVSSGMPSRILTFNIHSDSTWKNGDVYTLYYKPINSSGEIKTRILADYADGTTTYADDARANKDIYSLTLRLDSISAPLRVYGYMTVTLDKNTSFQIDSIALTRVRKELAPNFHTPARVFSITKNEDVSTSDAAADERPSTDNHSSHGNGSTRRQSSHVSRPAAAGVPKLSSDDSKHQSEHRKDALQHKPTPQQRQEANKRRTTTQTPLKRVPADMEK